MTQLNITIRKHDKEIIVLMVYY